ncbi:hypothetical protein PybrP1_009209 [[Pythium] brassicae (nom. inval.)]|nr:hypothetical protein PybrP1_009209 [[Pythium] brassicae (nom. inval.)]
MDSYVVVGTVLALVASAVLFLRPKNADDARLKSDMMRISEQMRMYQKQSAAAAPAMATTAAAATRKNSVDDDRGAFPGGRVAILFGSQTGTAEGFAEVLKKEGRKHGFAAHALDLEEYDAAEQLAKETCVIFVLATYGEGDPTDNAVPFIKWLKDPAGELAAAGAPFAGVNFTVFGLGNRQYEHYNMIGRLVDERMEQLGAKRMFHYGEGDDDASLDEDFEDWKETLWKDAPECEYACEEIRAGVAEQLLAQARSSDVRMKPSTKHFFTSTPVKVVVNRELRQSTAGGSTVHLEFDLRDTGLTYLTADNLAALPENLPSTVERLARRLGYDLAQWVRLSPTDADAKGELPFPSPCTIETILTRYLGINGAPRKDPLRQLAYYARDPAERARLLFLASKEGKDAYQQWVLDAERSYVDVLEHFASVQRVPLAALVELVPFLAPRYYTISSSSLVNPQRVHVTVSVIQHATPDGREFRGVASTYLAGLAPLGAHDDAKAMKKRESRPGEQGAKAPRVWPSARIFIRASTFRLPADPATPIVMVGPGTGIAPMRAFLHERAQQKARGAAVGPAVLFFGCRRRDEDFIYADELEQFEAQGVLTQLHLAFSRQQQEKVYVQHLLAQHGAAVWDLVHHQNAHIYVCGATGMGNDVHRVLLEIVERVGGQSPAAAAEMLKALQDTHRYVQELWA